MNSTGKERIAKIIGHKITNLLTSQIPPISLKWKEAPSATSTVEAKMEIISGNPDDVHKNAARTSQEPQEEPKLEGANTVSNNVDKDGGQVIHEEQANRDQEQKEDKLPSKRARRLPTTRHDDFSWLDINTN
jgi:hypothetical protein